MSMDEPGFPHFDVHTDYQPRKPFPGARLTSAGLYRRFPITVDSPHEPWCLHFEWGACTCGPREGEEFV